MTGKRQRGITDLKSWYPRASRASLAAGSAAGAVPGSGETRSTAGRNGKPQTGTEIHFVNVYANHISETKETSPKQGLSDRFIL
jgi:hypothetical protein